jgi:hypothetical protein
MSYAKETLLKFAGLLAEGWMNLIRIVHKKRKVAVHKAIQK